MSNAQVRATGKLPQLSEKTQTAGLPERVGEEHQRGRVMSKRIAVVQVVVWALVTTACGPDDRQRAEAVEAGRRASATAARSKAKSYVDACRRFADVVLERGRDTYGPKHTPLFVDGLHTETLEPVLWPVAGEKWILSNFANHQALLRLLDGLTTLTGEDKYRQGALDASAYALSHLRTPN
ncbi:hypothetical protein LCGC14_2978220, partial [marine sediment metagenome]